MRRIARTCLVLLALFAASCTSVHTRPTWEYAQLHAYYDWEPSGTEGFRWTTEGGSIAFDDMGSLVEHLRAQLGSSDRPAVAPEEGGAYRLELLALNAAGRLGWELVDFSDLGQIRTARSGQGTTGAQAQHWHFKRRR